jgi:hypothetical protein
MQETVKLYRCVGNTGEIAEAIVRGNEKLIASDCIFSFEGVVEFDGEDYPCSFEFDGDDLATPVAEILGKKCPNPPKAGRIYIAPTPELLRYPVPPQFARGVSGSLEALDAFKEAKKAGKGICEAFSHLSTVWWIGVNECRLLAEQGEPWAIAALRKEEASLSAAAESFWGGRSYSGWSESPF